MNSLVIFFFPQGHVLFSILLNKKQRMIFLFFFFFFSPLNKVRTYKELKQGSEMYAFDTREIQTVEALYW